MARIAGRRGRIYAGIAAAGTAEPIAFLNKWSINFTVGKIDVTAFGDANKTSLAGLPDATGDFGGFYDNASAQLYTAATDGTARKFYLYPDTDLNSQYFFGTAIFDFNIDGSVEGAVNVGGSWEASGLVQKVG
jgi:hypothetical protein